MSFFGFNTAGPGHNSSAPGFGQAHDPFAGLSNRNEDDEALEFDDTYDGLGDQLEESGDAFNDDTFGGGATEVTGGPAKPGKDFDFFGQTAQVSGAIQEEQLRFERQQPFARAGPSHQQYQQPGPVASNYHYAGASMPKPARSGYEKYNEPESDLQVDASLWGVAPKKPAAPAQAAAAPSRKMMSLEEVEAAMRAQSKPTPTPAQQAQAPAPQHVQPQPSPGIPPQQYGGYAPQQQAQQPQQQQAQFGNQHHGHGHPVQILQRPQSKQTPPATAPSQAAHQQQHQQQARQQPSAPTQPTQILQNPNRMSGDGRPPAQGRGAHGHRQQGSINLALNPHILQHPSQLQHLTEDQKQAQLEQEAKRAKRNHKIFLLSKDNGVMTPQDKNFITRIQLQQLVAATGNPNEHGDESLNEDFYYQVHTQIKGGQRQNPNQPLSNFAQTYLHQTGGRHGGMRRHNRGPENHMQRMEQQVQRAVEAAKNKPKNKQLVIEGSLGKISFSNAKTPKPLLNIKRSDSTQKAPQTATVMDRKSVLRDIEKVYTTLMKMEDHERKMPPPANDAEDLDLVQANVEWTEEIERLNKQLWSELKVHEPIGATAIHPFIAFLSFPKGKKAVNRVFRHASHQQRTTILTMIIYNMEQLDVIRGAQVGEETHLNASMREAIEMFSATVMMSLFGFMAELDLDLTTGVLGLICNKDVDYIARTRIGAAILTMILSRAEIIKQSGGSTDQTWHNWENMYTNFFNIIEPSLPNIFPGTATSGEDMYVWQLLAAMGIGANPDQQQRLVLAVKDRVMNTVAIAKTLPAEMSSQRLGNVNLFMRSIGLDVELLQ